MSVTFIDYGNRSGNTIVGQGTSTSPSSLPITLLSATEIDTSLTNANGTHLIKITGQFDLASLTSTPATVADLMNDPSLGTVSSFQIIVNGSLGEAETYSSPINFPDYASYLGLNGNTAQAAAFNSILSGNDVYTTSADATGTNSVIVDLYGGNNTFVENHTKLQYDDVFYGGSSTGINTAVLPGNFANYTVTANLVYDVSTKVNDLNGYTITDQTGATNTLDVYQVERLQFHDTNLALDVMNGHAGEAAEILGAVFGMNQAQIAANPHYVAIGLQLLDGGMSFSQLSALALNAVNATTPQTVVNLLYTNLMGSAPTPTQAAPFLQLLSSGAMSVGDLAVAAENSSLCTNANHINLLGLSQTGIHYI